MKKFVIATILATGFAVAASAQEAKATQSAASNMPPASTKTDVTYATDIKPILDASCVKCHDATKPKVAAKLGLDTLDGTLKGNRNGKIVVPGDSAKSKLVLSIAHIGDPESFMPKGKGAKKLTDDQIGLIRAWIDQGAK
jgi:mono/diheme cytochrome c family protein